ncbi:HNH/ENDO VII family nuclease [Ruminococcus sp. JL13D9]|uniref:HNH/ENDO VII family nuclease n=1 Tax=Ruminococcus sp. JL13D9 TaxID=3233381 RepID=UPI00389A1C70
MMRYMKKSIALILSLLIMLSILQGCSAQKNEQVESKESETTAETTIADLKNNHTDSVPEFEGLSDPRLAKYMEDAVYAEVIDHIDTKKYVVENVEAVYISKEYLEEAAYNSKSNIYFGYTKDELDKQFSGTKYVFTLGDDGKTTVEKFEPYDDTYDKILLNVAIGTGVILVCVVLTVATEGAGAPAAAAIFAASAKSGAIAAASSALIGGTAAGVITGIETEDFDESMKAAMLSGSEGLKWGAITGALTGGASEAMALKGATSGGLTMNQVAQIQKESKIPLDVIKELKTMEQYNILKKAGITPRLVNYKTALVRDIDLNFIDEMGRTNLVRMQQGLAPLDSTGVPYELHHIGQEVDSTLAILTREEHRLAGNSKIWHEFGTGSDVHAAGNNWDEQRKLFWQAFANLVGG